MHLSVICSTTPLLGDVAWGRRGGDLNDAKFKCTAPIGHPSQSNPYTISLTLNIAWVLQGDWLVNVHTSVRTYGEWSNSPCIGQASFGIKLKSNTPPFPLHSPGGGYSGA